MIRILGLLVMILLFFCACKRDKENSHKRVERTDYHSVIRVPAGEMYSQFGTYQIPTFFNVGEIELTPEYKVSTIVLGPRMGKNKKVAIMPIATFSITIDSTRLDYVVSHDQQFSDDSLSYEMFMVKHAEVINGIESWFRSQCLTGKCRDFKWGNTYKSLLEIDKKNLKN